MSEPFIAVKNLHYTYDTDTGAPIPALRGIDLEIEAGEYLALVGQNGSGKSTLARCLNGLLLPTEGEVWVCGINTRQSAKLVEVRAQVGIVFQHPENQFVATTVEEEIAFGPENLGLPPAELRARVETALRDAGLLAFRQHNPRVLSAGQKARLAIASILAMRPACLILDESTAMLDPLSRRQILALLQELHREGLTLITITHFMDEAALAERVIVLDEGQIALQGSPRQVFAQRARLAEIGLDLPPVTTVAAGLARRGAAIAPELLTIEELGNAVRGLLPPAHSFYGTKAPIHPPARGLATQSSAEPIAAVRNLAHTYLPNTPVSTTALYNATLTLERQSIHGLLGRSGAGKSTLVQFLNGLLRPSQAGRVIVLGQDLAQAQIDLRGLRRRVGLVFQHPHHQLFERYVGDDVAYGPRQLGLRGEALRERVRWAMEAVGLNFEAFVDRRTFSLSGGEMRRAALAGVIALKPELLILDEATTGLDPRGRRDIHALLRRLRNEEGTTVLLVSNDMAEVAQLTDRITILDDGRTVLAGSAREVLGQETDLIAYGLLPPPAIEISEGLRGYGVPLDHSLLTTDELEEALWNVLTP